VRRRGPRRIQQLGRLQRLALRQVLLDERLADERARLDELHVGDAVVDGLPLFARGDETPFLEHTQVLGDVMDRDPDVGGQVAHAALAVADRMEDRLAMLVRERLAELGVHAVEGRQIDGGAISIVFMYLHGCLYTLLCRPCQVHWFTTSPPDGSCRPDPPREDARRRRPRRHRL